MSYEDLFRAPCPVCEVLNDPHFIVDTYPAVYLFKCTWCDEEYSSRNPEEVAAFMAKYNKKEPG